MPRSSHNMQAAKPGKPALVKTRVFLFAVCLLCSSLPALSDSTRNNESRMGATTASAQHTVETAPSLPASQTGHTASSTAPRQVPVSTADQPTAPERNTSAEDHRTSHAEESSSRQADRTTTIPDSGTVSGTRMTADDSTEAATTERSFSPNTPPLRPSTRPSSVQLLSAPSEQTAPTKQVPLVLYDEWLLVSDSIDDALEAHRLLSPFGLKIKRRQQLSRLGLVISVYRTPEGVDPLDMFEKVRIQLPELNIEFNQRYPLLSAAEKKKINVKHYGQQLTGIGIEGCKNYQGTIAMMDSKVNPDLPEFAAFKLKTLDLALLKNEVVSDHGTAVAYLFSQILPEANLLAINVYQQTEENIETRTDWLLSGFEQVLEHRPQPRVLNMSFGGNPSKVLEAALDKLARLNIRLIAAAGNGGPGAEAVYPAAYEQVVAVTAVDIQQALWKQSNQGDYLSFSAPGVDLWLLTAKGKKRYMSGTSFAAPWASALASLATEAQWQQPAMLSKDLGAAGFDSRFGHGLIQFNGLCST